MGIWKRIKNALAPGRLEAELAEEEASHLEEMQGDGWPEAAYGRGLRYREESRDLKTVGWLDCLRADVVFGVRQLGKHRLASAVAVLSLALGIGATASTLQLIEAGFWRVMPVEKPEQLHFLRYVTMNIDGKPKEQDSFRATEMKMLAESVAGDATLTAVGFADRQDVHYGEPTQVERISRQYVSGGFFELLGLRPELGRLFRKAEESPAADHKIAVISGEYWERRFGREPGVIGKKIFHDGISYEVVGVVEGDFTGTSVGSYTDLFLPMPTEVAPEIQPIRRVLLRIREGVNPAAIEDRLRARFVQAREELSQPWAAKAPKSYLDVYRNVRLKMLPAMYGMSNFHSAYRTPLTVLGLTTLLLLGLACAGVANLLLAQTTGRQREMGIRMAIGAGRMRLMQLLFVESGLLGLGAAGLGLVFTLWAGPALLRGMNPADNPVKLGLAMDWRLPLVGGALALLVTLVCGVVPAWRVSRVDPATAIRAGFSGKRRMGMFHALLGVQIAFCVVVCFVAVLMVTTLRNLENQQLGFEVDRVLLLETQKPEGRLDWETWRQVLERVRGMRGVEKVGLSGYPLQTGNASIGDVEIAGRRLGLGGPFTFEATPGWMEAMGVELVEGRDFLASSEEQVVVVSEQVKREYFEGKSPLGQTVNWAGEVARIIGVAKDIRMRDLKEDTRSILYFPFRAMRDGVFAIRMNGTVKEAELAPLLRGMITREFPQLRVGLIRSQKSLIDAQLARERLLATVASFFSVVALVLAGLGIYGVFSLIVAQRRKEIAIRIAVGAGWWATARIVLRDGLGAAMVGLAGGLAGVFGAEALMRSLVFGVEGVEWVVVVPTAGVVLAAAIVGLGWPLTRALRTDPALVLRTD